MKRISEFAEDGWGLFSLDWLVLTTVLLLTTASVVATGAAGQDLAPVAFDVPSASDRGAEPDGS